MTRLQVTRTVLAWRHDGLVLSIVLLLLIFTYGARADLLGTCAHGRAWAQVSARPLLIVIHYLASGLLLGVLPVLVARKLLNCRLQDLGLGWGRPRRGLVWLAVGIPLAITAGKIAALSPGMRAVYPLDPTVGEDPSRFASSAFLSFFYYGAWEVVFRGVLLFGLKDRLGSSAANMLQTALSVTAHFGRPFDETFSAVPAGLVFGSIGLHTGSIWYVAVVHWVVGVSTDWFITAG